MDEIHIRLRISNLEARMVMREIEIAALSREIGSPLTSSKRRAEATERRDTEHEQWWQIKTELEALRKAYPGFARH